MNAGTDYHKAKAQAKANADRDGFDRVLHMYRKHWWISRLRDFTNAIPDDAEVIYAASEKYQTDEHCQYCGNSWQQTRTVGTPRLDSVPCPSCKRLV
jgi:hypothetical protein